jgi:hypothetical protein
VNEPDNETFNPFAVRAKLPLRRYPVLDEYERPPDDYKKLWIRAFTGQRRSMHSPRIVATEFLMRRLGGTELWNAFCNARQPGPR